MPARDSGYFGTTDRKSMDVKRGSYYGTGSAYYNGDDVNDKRASFQGISDAGRTSVDEIPPVILNRMSMDSSVVSRGRASVGYDRPPMMAPKVEGRKRHSFWGRKKR